MQTRKKIVASSTIAEQTSPKYRLQKKTMVVSEKKVTELITSSPRKQKAGKIFAKKTRDAKVENNLKDNREGNEINCPGSEDHKQVDGRNTIFSPAFHISNDGHSGNTDHEFMDISSSEDATGVGSLNFGIERSKDGQACPESKDATICPTSGVQNGPHGDQNDEVLCSSDTYNLKHYSDARNSCEDKPLISENACPNPDGECKGTLHSKVSAAYFAKQNTRSLCVEQSQESISIECDVEEDEIDEFDPYLFIKYLPELSSVVPTFRPILLPKQTRSCPSTTLVLDLDETLVHSTLEACSDVDFTFPVTFNSKDHTVYVRCRPYLKEFLDRVSCLFEIIIFTASQSIYAEQLLNMLDSKRRFFRHRVYRESCVFVDGNYLKDLSVLGRDLTRVVMVDNSPQAFGFQVDNGIPIESWFDDRSDKELLLLLPFLESLVGVEDVRPLIAEKFNLRRRIEAAVPSMYFGR